MLRIVRQKPLRPGQFIGRCRRFSVSKRKAIDIGPGSTRVGFIGMGVMGRYMAEHIYNAGFTNMTVYNRTASKCKPLEDLGAKRVDAPIDVAKNSDVVITCVGYPRDVESVILDEKTGVLAGMKDDGVIIDMTTSKPALAQKISEKATAKGVHSVDAPVSGGDVGAKNGTLSMMIGGEEHIVNDLNPIFSAMGKTIKYMGPPGCGQHTKMANQIIICTNMIGMCEGLIYAYKAGLDPEEVWNAVSKGAAGSFSLTTYSPRIFRRDFKPGFMIEHFVKDLEIALDEARRLELSLPGLALAHQLYVALKAQGEGKRGTHALQIGLERLNNIHLPTEPEP
eukprot:Clim_evm34s202 gene=Clim_evmTU34s202